MSQTAWLRSRGGGGIKEDVKRGRYLLLCVSLLARITFFFFRFSARALSLCEARRTCLSLCAKSNRTCQITGTFVLCSAAMPLAARSCQEDTDCFSIPS